MRAEDAYILYESGDFGSPSAAVIKSGSDLLQVFDFLNYLTFMLRVLVVVNSFRLESTFSSFGMDGRLEEKFTRQGACVARFLSTWAQVARTDLPSTSRLPERSFSNQRFRMSNQANQFQCPRRLHQASQNLVSSDLPRFATASQLWFLRCIEVHFGLVSAIS